jgi:hypothetical protein
MSRILGELSGPAIRVPIGMMERKRGITRRSFVMRSTGALLAAYGGLLHGLPLLGLQTSAAETAEMGAMLGTTQAALGAMQLGS